MMKKWLLPSLLALALSAGAALAVTGTNSANQVMEVWVGKLKVGDGTAGTATGDEDAYIEGDLEVDGTFNPDGATDLDGAVNVDGAFTATGTFAVSGAADFTKAAAADAGTTTDSLEIALDTPVDTTGTNVHNALTLDLGIGNASGGTNTATALQIDAITGDAQVSLNGINIGALTGTGATEKAVTIASGWDEGLTNASPSLFTADAEFDSTITVDSTVIAENGIKYAARGQFTVCGDIATVNNNTIYYGPSQAVIDSATAGMITCNTDAAGNATEATASEPPFAGRAWIPLGMMCYSTDMGATGSPLTYTLRVADAAYDAGAITLSIADNILSGVSPANTIGATEVAADSAVAVALASSGDVGAGAFICRISYAY